MRLFFAAFGESEESDGVVLLGASVCEEGEYPRQESNTPMETRERVQTAQGAPRLSEKDNLWADRALNVLL